VLTRLVRTLVAVTVVAAVLGGCRGDDDDDGGGSATPPTAPSATQAAATPSTPTPAARAAALCALADAPLTATVQAPELVETSGLAVSRPSSNNGVIWAHNDSGDTARIIAFAADGAPRGVFELRGAEAIDWEDMAIAPIREEATPALFDMFLGDIGDNAAARTEIVVYRVREPQAAPAGGVIDVLERIVLRYPDTPHDAETLMADPLTGDLVIVTKEIIAGDSAVYVTSEAALATGTTTATLERAGTITKATLTSGKTAPDGASALVAGVGWLPTGGDISRDGALIAIRTYASVFIWAREEGQSVAEALAAAPCEAPSALEAQGEAIAFTAEGDGYYTVSEGASPTLYRVGGE
jgi:hypothetical protein